MIVLRLLEVYQTLTTSLSWLLGFDLQNKDLLPVGSNRQYGVPLSHTLGNHYTIERSLAHYIFWTVHEQR